MKRLRQQLRILKKQKDECEKRILIYLEQTKQPGVRLNGRVILAKSINRRKYQKRRDKLDKGVDVLRRYGISNSQKALEELLEEMRGSPETVRVLKIQK
jgi:hypothetical protein